MKKIYCILALLLCLLFAGCGKQEAQYYDIVSEEQSFFDVASANGRGAYFFRTMQFYQGEPVQVWSFRENDKTNIYLYKMDGSSKLLLKGAPEEETGGNGYVDREGNYYYWTIGGIISKTDPSGKRIFTRQLSKDGIFSIERICQPADDRIYVLYKGVGDGLNSLGILDPSTGEISKVNNAVSGLSVTTGIGSGQGCLCYLKEHGVEKVDAEAGHVDELWSFSGTTYIPELSTTYPVWDFQIRDDGSLELLRAGKKGENGAVVTLRKEPAGEGKKTLTLRGTSFENNTWLKACVSRFNRENEEWYVALEECGPYTGRWEDYAMQTSVEIATGKGPDILYGDVLGDYAAGVFQKGGMTELSSYLAESGIKETDFFPWVFSSYRDGEAIYSVTPRTYFGLLGHGSVLMDAAALSGEGEPDIEMLVDSLLTGSEDDFFLMAEKSDDLLDLFLEGSESLWGMVDWTTGTCDFDTELFHKIMEAAKRFEDTVERGGETFAEAFQRLEEAKNGPQPLAKRERYHLYQYLDQDLLRESGKVQVGVLFDDGCHAYAGSSSTVAINVNSDKKEGAWEFIRFLLEEGQPEEYDGDYPAARKAFDAMMEKELAKGLYVENYEKYHYKDDGIYLLDERRIQGIREILEDARFIPLRTQPILDVIHEEAGTYFSGEKSIKEVCAIINNRVQVYLDENSNP